jgi:UDP-N-acetylglucosamine acyltransferase
MKGATIGLGATVHQYSLIGSYSMVGMNSVVGVKCRITPGKIFAGNPARSAGENVIGLTRNNVSDDYLKKETNRFWYILDGD